MHFDFATVRNRLNTDSQKWQKYQGRDILPMWVADMDFQSPPAVIEALHRRVDEGVFGYARPLPSTTAAVVNYLARRHHWEISPDWLVWLPGLVVGLNVTARAFAGEGDEVLCLTPVYPPFMSAPRNAGRAAVCVPLRLVGGQAAARWEIDWDALEAAVTPRAKVLFFCNPHNPVARVFRREEIARLAGFCARRDLVLCSDEIHCDLILEDKLPHIPAAVAAPEHAGRIVTLIAPSKTYNVPGLGTSLAVIPDPSLRARFNRAAAGIVAEVNCLGYAACEAAYNDCEDWRRQLVAALRGNRDCLLGALSGGRLPGVRVAAPIEATYLAWLDVSALRLADPVAHFEAFGVGLSDGRFFGAAPGTHVRINFGCPRATLEEALRRMEAAVAGARSNH